MIGFVVGVLVLIGVYFASVEVGFMFTKQLNPDRDRSDVMEKVFAFIFGVLFIILFTCIGVLCYKLGNGLINIKFTNTAV